VHVEPEFIAERLPSRVVHKPVAVGFDDHNRLRKDSIKNRLSAQGRLLQGCDEFFGRNTMSKKSTAVSRQTYNFNLPGGPLVA
jgi:hypothetical protein